MPALVALFTVLAAAFLWWQSERSQALLQQQVLLQAEKRSIHLADAMGGQVSGLITTLDLQLRDLRREWLRDPDGFGDIALGVLQALPPGFVTHISVANADGYVVYDSLATPIATFIGDRTHFQAQRDAAADDRLVISQPVESRIAQGWAVVVNRPILKEGRFDGVVQLVVSTTFISRRLAALQLSEQDVVALIAPNGAFLARSLDHQGAMGASVPADRPFLTNRAAQSGSFRTEGLLDGIARTYGWYRLRATGLVVAIGIADQAVLAPLAPAFESNRRVTAALIALLLVSGGLITALLVHLGRKASALEASEVLRLRQFESSPLGMLVMDTTTYRFIDCNEAALAIYGYPNREALLSKSPLDVSTRVQADGRSSAEKGQAYFAQDRWRVSDSTTLTLGPALDLLSGRTLLSELGLPGDRLVIDLQRERRLTVVQLAGDRDVRCSEIRARRGGEDAMPTPPGRRQPPGPRAWPASTPRPWRWLPGCSRPGSPVRDGHRTTGRWSRNRRRRRRRPVRGCGR